MPFQYGLERLPTSIRADLVLTLLEAARFSHPMWQDFFVERAKEFAVPDLHGDAYLDARLAQSRYRLDRKSEESRQAAASPVAPSIVDKRTHAAMGEIAIQHALHCLNDGRLSEAKSSLESWSPLDQTPSPMEQAVLFNRDVLLGRVLRLQGEFRDSLKCLERARKIAVAAAAAGQQRRGLVFDQDAGVLACQLAKTLLELDDPVSAELHLRAEISQQAQHDEPAVVAHLYNVQLLLAEALFAQDRFEEAETLCLAVRARRRLTKPCKLRTSIALAMISHVQSHNEEALSRWRDAMHRAMICKPVDPHSTRAIAMSICDVARRLDDPVLLRESLEQLAALAKPAGLDWSKDRHPDLRRWSRYLLSGGLAKVLDRREDLRDLDKRLGLSTP